MGTLLDTDIVIAAERQGASLPRGDAIGLASITASELLFGVLRADLRHRADRSAFVEGVLSGTRVIPFDVRIARVHARLWVDLSGSGRLPGPNDLIVAATALSVGWELATLNRRHFADVPGLVLVDL